MKSKSKSKGGKTKGKKGISKGKGYLDSTVNGAGGDETMVQPHQWSHNAESTYFQSMNQQQLTYQQEQAQITQQLEQERLHQIQHITGQQHHHHDPDHTQDNFQPPVPPPLQPQVPLVGNTAATTGVHPQDPMYNNMAAASGTYDMHPQDPMYNNMAAGGGAAAGGPAGGGTAYLGNFVERRYDWGQDHGWNHHVEKQAVGTTRTFSSGEQTEEKAPTGSYYSAQQKADVKRFRHPRDLKEIRNELQEDPREIQWTEE